MRITILLVLIGCGNPVENCSKPGTDCCENAAQCEAVFGEVAPFCGPGAHCTECLIDQHCPTDLVCMPDSKLGALCL